VYFIILYVVKPGCTIKYLFLGIPTSHFILQILVIL